jgi:hypothetical protein
MFDMPAVLYLMTLLVFRAVGMSTRYVLGVSGFPLSPPPGFQVGGGGDSIIVQTVLEVHSQWVPGLFLGGKAAAAWR